MVIDFMILIGYSAVIIIEFQESRKTFPNVQVLQR